MQPATPLRNLASKCDPLQRAATVARHCGPTTPESETSGNHRKEHGMESVYQDDNFHGRVNFAASYISAGRQTTRAFDSCFEMNDGAAVALALYRRTLKKPSTKLAQNIWRYLVRETIEREAAEYAYEPDLAALAARLRSRSKAVDAAIRAYREDCRNHPNYHDGTPRKAWSDLSNAARETWIKNPTPRFSGADLT